MCVQYTHTHSLTHTHILLFRVTFQFKSSKRSNNGTDVGSGQIPEFLYRLPELESEEGEELQLLGREFSSTVSPVRILCTAYKTKRIALHIRTPLN